MSTDFVFSKRVELKYFIDVTQYYPLLKDFLVFMDFDPHLEKATQSYRVWSLYFDSPHLNAYLEKLDGLNVRHKLRFRTYGRPNLAQTINVEVKSRVKFQTLKIRSQISYPVYDRLQQSRYCWSTLLPLCENGNLKKFYQIARLTNAIPAVLVKYTRQALIGRREPDIRVTFDWGLQRTTNNIYDFFNLPQYMPSVFPAHQMVLEIKFRDYMPDWIYFLIKKYRLFNQAISKYTICLQNTGL